MRDYEYWLCDDCFLAYETGDDSSLEYYYGDDTDRIARQIDAGLAKLPPLLPDWTDDDGIEEFSHIPCDCCGAALAGSRHRYTNG